MAESLTTDQAKQVAALPRKAGRLQLAKYLKWSMDDFDEDIDMKKSIILDYYYDNLMFAIKTGFPWSEVCTVFELAKEVQSDAIGLPLTDAIILYKNKAVQLSNVTANNLKTFTSYFFVTFMQHYKLYQFISSQEREPMISLCKLHVYPPPEPLPFKQGKEHLVWNYEQKLQELDLQERERRENILKNRQDLVLSEDQVLEEPYREIEADVALDRERLSKLIDEAATAHISLTQKNLQTKIQEKHENLEFLFEKTALPRPAVLGAPPRIKSPTKSSAKSRQSTRGGTKTALSDRTGGSKSRAPSKTSVRGKTPKS
ncbi:uncharacterized protein C8orf74 homolog [Glandiceps talaboti]